MLGQIEGDTVELHLADAGASTLIRQDEKSPALYGSDVDAGLTIEGIDWLTFIR